MTEQEKDKYYKLFVDTWGEDAQLDMCIEEMAELIQAINKYKRRGRRNSPEEIMYNLHEEIADVLNMMGQMQYIFDKEKIEEIRVQKLIKCENKINGQKK